MMKLITVSALALTLGACATVTRGTTNSITVNSEPAGAQAVTSNGLTCPSTPCTWDVNRKQEFIVTFTKDGYEDLQVPVATRLAGAGAAGFAGNVLVGGLIGMGVDAATGSTLEHYPNPVMGVLKPLSKPAPATPIRQRRRPEPARVPTADAGERAPGV